MDLTKWEIFEPDSEDLKQIILSAPSKEEAEWAFEELGKILKKYRNKKVVWKAELFEDGCAVGTYYKI